MKPFNINISDDVVLKGVYRLTANAAVQRGDAQHVASVDNEGMLLQFMGEGKRVLAKSFGRYSAGELRYSMPDEWPDRSADVNALAEVFLTNYVIAKWFELNGTGDRFRDVANEAMNEIVVILSQRKKPI